MIDAKDKQFTVEIYNTKAQIIDRKFFSSQADAIQFAIKASISEKLTTITEVGRHRLFRTYLNGRYVTEALS